MTASGDDGIELNPEAVQSALEEKNAEIDSLSAKIAQLEEPVFIKTSAMTASGDDGIELNPEAVQSALEEKNIEASELSHQLDASKAREKALAASLKVKTASEQGAIEQAEDKMSKGMVAAIVVGSAAVVGVGAFMYAKR
jgi:chromosome segregation ATPase